MNARTLRQVLIVCRKELRDSLRDRRALFPIALAVLIYPALIALMMNRIAGRQRQAEEITLPVVGRENAPALVDWLSQQSGVRIVNGPADPEQEVREGRQSVVVIIPREFAEKFRVSRPAPVKIVEDSSRDGERPKVERVRRLLSGYSNEIGSLRLVARGVSPAVAAAVQVEDIEVSSAQQRAATTLAFIPMMVLIAAFTGGMQIATDSTAGERERVRSSHCWSTRRLVARSCPASGQRRRSSRSSPSRSRPSSRSRSCGRFRSRSSGSASGSALRNLLPCSRWCCRWRR
jgi:sodium transport system permease protein